MQIIISPAALTEALNKAGVFKLVKKLSLVNISAESKSGKANFLIYNPRTGVSREVGIAATIKKPGAATVSVAFCNIMSKLSVEAIIQAEDGKLTIKAGNGSYGLPLLESKPIKPRKVKEQPAPVDSGERLKFFWGGIVKVP